MNQQRVEEMFGRIDAMDTDGYLRFLTEDVKFRFGSMPEAVGQAAVRDGTATFFSAIKGIRHTLTGYWSSGDTVMVRLEVEYTRHDGRQVTLPCANIFEVRGGLIADYRIYMDVTPVFA